MISHLLRWTPRHIGSNSQPGGLLFPVSILPATRRAVNVVKEITMPFKSARQRRWMFANKPKMAKRWAKHSKRKRSRRRKTRR
jgi:hypothetical protein